MSDRPFKSEPRFRLDKSGGAPRVFVQCSQCAADLRQLDPGERIKVTQAYYCDACDPGVTVLNPPRRTP